MNLREVEQVLSDLILYELSEQKPSFHECFFSAFIKATNGNDSILLDLTSDLTVAKKKKQNGNSILQNVLEFFYFHEIVDATFYDKMSDFGITTEMGDKAINTLIRTPFSLLDPEYIYAINGDSILYKRYLINNKGRTYVKDVLRNELYFRDSYHIKSARSLFDEKG